MTQRRIDVVNTKTGELNTGILVWLPDRPKIGGFFMGFQDAFLTLSKDTDLTPQAWRVLAYLLANLDFENFIHIKQKEVAEQLEINKSNMSKIFALLKQKEIILEAPYKGVKCYKLNHFYGWKGKVISFRQEQKKTLELIQGGKE